VHFDLIPNISLCLYASRTLRMKLLTWCRVINLAGFFGSGSARAQVCQNISGLHTKLFYNIKSNDFFFRDVDLLCSLRYTTSVSEVIVIFLQLILFANTAAFFYSLLGLV